MPAPLAGILARVGASLFGRAAAAQAGTKAATGVAGAGASLAERATVLKKTDQLLSRSVAGAMLGKDPLDVGLQQRVAASEKRVQQEALQRAKKANEQEAVASKYRGRLIAGLKQFAFWTAVLPIGLKKMADAINVISSSILERQRVLSPFSGRIATAFAKLELTTRRLQVQRAAAVGGSTARLAEDVGQLRKDIEPVGQISTTLMNFFGSWMAMVGGNLAKIAEFGTDITGIAALAKLWEGQQKAAAAPFVENWQAMLAGNFAANDKLPLGRDQGVAALDRRDAEMRGAIGMQGQQRDQDNQEREAVENRRRRQEVAFGGPDVVRNEPPPEWLMR